MNLRRDDSRRLSSYRLQCHDRLVQFLATGRLIEKTGTDWVWYNATCGVCPSVPENRVTSYSALWIIKPPALWWAKYWEGVIALVEECPCTKTFKECNWESTLRFLARKCLRCYQAAVKEYPIFSETAAGVMESLIDGVRIHGDPSIFPPKKGLTPIRQVELEIKL